MVKVYAIAMCYNEIDIIEEFISHVHRQDFDGLILLDHFSNDGTQMQLVKLQDELKADKTFDFQIFYTRNRSFDKVNKINGMAAYAHFVAHSGRKGDTWIVPMDCDEFWQTDSNTPLAVKLKEEEAFFYNCFYNHMRNYMNTAVGYDKYYLAPSDKRQQLRNEKCCFIWDEDIWATSGYHNLMSKPRFPFQLSEPGDILLESLCNLPALNPVLLHRGGC